MATQQSITSLPSSPADDRHRRMANYSIAMGIRMACVVLCFFVQGWWLLVMALGAVLLPYFAVVLANNVGNRSGAAVERPGGLVVYGPAEPIRVVPVDEQSPKAGA